MENISLVAGKDRAGPEGQNGPHARLPDELGTLEWEVAEEGAPRQGGPSCSRYRGASAPLDPLACSQNIYLPRSSHRATAPGRLGFPEQEESGSAFFIPSYFPPY